MLPARGVLDLSSARDSATSGRQFAGGRLLALHGVGGEAFPGVNGHSNPPDGVRERCP